MQLSVNENKYVYSHCSTCGTTLDGPWLHTKIQGNITQEVFFRHSWRGTLTSEGLTLYPPNYNVNKHRKWILDHNSQAISGSIEFHPNPDINPLFERLIHVCNPVKEVEK